MCVCKGSGGGEGRLVQGGVSLAKVAPARHNKTKVDS